MYADETASQLRTSVRRIMADLSLDEIIATKKGLNFTVQFQNQNARKGKPNQSRPGLRAGFITKPNRPGLVQQKRPFVKPGLKAKTAFRSPAPNNGSNINLAGPGKGQIDARDMITIKNRIKIPDARAKIVQKRINQGSFDARSKLQPQMKVRPQGPGGQQQQQQASFQKPQQPVRPQGQQQRFQQPRQQGFQFQQPRPNFQQQVPQFNQQQQGPHFNQQQQQGPSQFNQPFNQQGPSFNQQRLQGPKFNQPQQQSQLFNQQQQGPPQFRGQPPAQMNRPPAGFNQSQSNFSNLQQPAPFHQVPNQTGSSGDLINFTVAVNTGQPSAEPMAPLTRTLVNPLASGGALVEDTGNSLKITRSIPDVTFDGQKLTVTRRVPPSQKPPSSSFSNKGSRPVMDDARGPIMKIQNDRVQRSPVQAPAPSNMIRTHRGPSRNQQQRARPPSPIQAPAPSKRPAPVKPTNTGPPSSQAPPPARPAPARITPPARAAAPTRLAPAQAQSQSPPPAEYVTNTRYKTVKNVPATAAATAPRAQSHSAPARARATVNQSPLASNRPAQSAFSRIQLHEPERSALSTQLSSSPSLGLSITKRLAPHPSSMRPLEADAAPEEPVVSAQKVAVKRRAAPRTLSELFTPPVGWSGKPIPVITDHGPAKKRRVPEAEPVLKEEYEEDVETTEQIDDDGEVDEDEPGTTLLSPLQGFRILVSNLHASVTQDDIIELFGAIGPLKRANLLTKGQAEVAFIHKEHAIMALKKYHNRELDGQPMFVKLTTPLNAKVMKPVEDSPTGLPAALRELCELAKLSGEQIETPPIGLGHSPERDSWAQTSKKPSAQTSAPVEIPLIHKALFKTGTDAGPSKSVRFTVKL